MRRFLTLAIITAIGAWALKRLAEVGNDNVCYEGMPQFSDEEEDLQSQTVDDVGGDAIPLPWEEEVHLESQPAEASVFDGVEIQSPFDLDQPPRTGDDWSLPVGPNGEEEHRANVYDRLHNLVHRRKRDDEAVA